MIELICSDCSCNLDTDSRQHSSSIELRVTPCTCKDLEINDLYSQVDDLNNQIEVLNLQVENLEHALTHI